MIDFILYLTVAVILTEYITGFLKNSVILEKPRSKIVNCGKFLSDLFECGYCLSVWVSISVTTISLLRDYLPKLTGDIETNYLVIIIMTCSLSNVFHGLRDRYAETYKDSRYLRQDVDF